jgi:hypothetical protein
VSAFRIAPAWQVEEWRERDYTVAGSHAYLLTVSQRQRCRQCGGVLPAGSAAIQVYDDCWNDYRKGSRFLYLHVYPTTCQKGNQP